MSSVVYIPWYATILRHDAFAEAVKEISSVALRYGATKHAVHRSRDDRYKITQMAWFESELDWYKYWEGPEMIRFRAENSGRYQVPVVYVWHDEITAGEIVTADEHVPAA
ncbi:MAG TPA: hypothetical protein VG388_15270 [Solirubrobacteraceae bacterium]|jgi:hypothetical protein|nr:hypothetical protein [Solirubrobacteraceae bacterium]